MNKVLIVDMCDTGGEREAIRQSLERFGYTVLVKPVGRPQDFIDILQGDLLFDADFVIFSCHGENGKIIMPTLAEHVYYPDEPRGDFGAEEIEKYCNLKGKVIICTGCATGRKSLADAFSRKNTYIAPTDYIEGDSVLMFIIRMFYELKNRKDLSSAFETAREMDSETELYALYGYEEEA